MAGTAYEVFTQALAACPYPATQIPVRGTGEIYVSYEEVRGSVTRNASNRPRALQHVMQVDIWSRRAVGPELYTVLEALWAFGITVDNWGPLSYEPETLWFHMPITCEYNERVNREGD